MSRTTNQMYTDTVVQVEIQQQPPHAENPYAPTLGQTKFRSSNTGASSNAGVQIKTMLEEVDIRMGEARREAAEFKKEVIVGAEDPRSGATAADKFVKCARSLFDMVAAVCEVDNASYAAANALGHHAQARTVQTCSAVLCVPKCF